MTSTTTATTHKNVWYSLKDTLEQLVVAFILAFVFRAFVVEAFVIPTGSMADTLRGAHFRLTCPTCGYGYNYGFIPERYRWPEGYVPNTPTPVVPGPAERLRQQAIPVCPMCHTQAPIQYPQWVSNGDRILVMKYIYQFAEPRMWDVVVFKNPPDPDKNYIKRLIATPGQTVEIIDGDIYIDGTIQHKPRHVQDIHWLKTWDNNYQPDTTTGLIAYNRQIWPQPFTPAHEPSAWTIDHKQLHFDFKGAAQSDGLIFSPNHLQYLLSNFNAYNGPPDGLDLYTSDLKLQFIWRPQSDDCGVSASISKYGREYRATVQNNGHVAIEDLRGSKTLGFADFPATGRKPQEVSFAILDHQFILQVGEQELKIDGPNAPQEWGYDPAHPTAHLPAVALAGQGGAFQLQDIALFRDIHYTNSEGSGRMGRATEGNALTLQQDEFFVMGDNSPRSYDSRFWAAEGKSNLPGQSYRAGVVPRDYLIGKALFVYWPGGFRLPVFDKIAVVPDVGDMRFIH